MSEERPPILFVHGAWVNARCWDGWKARAEALGYECHAPSWPHLDGVPAELRRNPPAALADLGIEAIVAHYEAIAKALPRPPILIGHSFGGLFVQLLLTRGIGCGAVAIHPAPPAGVVPSWSAVKASWPVIGTWGHWKKIMVMSFADWVWCFTHQLPVAEQNATYDALVVPAPGRVYFEAATKPALVTPDFVNKERGPLLIVSGDADRTVTAAMNATNFALYKKGAVIEKMPTVGRSHFTLGEPGWEGLFDDVFAWLGRRVVKANP